MFLLVVDIRLQQRVSALVRETHDQVTLAAKVAVFKTEFMHNRSGPLLADF